LDLVIVASTLPPLPIYFSQGWRSPNQFRRIETAQSRDETEQSCQIERAQPRQIEMARPRQTETNWFRQIETEYPRQIEEPTCQIAAA
jgi:hypothetical protein